MVVNCKKFLLVCPFVKEAYYDDRDEKYIKKGMEWYCKTHLAYFRLVNICPEYAREMLRKIRDLPEETDEILSLLSKEGYTIKDLSKILEINRAFFYNKKEELGTVLKHFYAYRVIARKYITLCFENGRIEKCEFSIPMKIKKPLF